MMNPELSAAIVHDLKNALGLIEGELELMARRDDASERIRFLWQHAAGMRLRLMEFLTLYQDDLQALPVSIDEQVLSEFLTQVCGALVSPSGPELSVVIEDDLRIAYFDARLVSLALQSALSNARAFARTEIILGVRRVYKSLVFFVADDGPGPNSGPTPGGTGLGMKVCQLVARAHSTGTSAGYCALNRRAPAGGAVFELSLPQ
ncbi:MAG: HAMP domain-containing histidine kinase [Burkholderiaceae bacterium]|nr:HAMP domain-containing histidine kinase [Burkholderiaceae bacterium]